MYNESLSNDLFEPPISGPLIDVTSKVSAAIVRVIAMLENERIGSDEIDELNNLAKLMNDRTVTCWHSYPTD